jgi:hypothetical protein
MLEFTVKQLAEFQALCKKHFGHSPTVEEARTEAAKLITLISLIQPERSATEPLQTNADDPKI